MKPKDRKKYKNRCLEDNPDCLHCPFPDCVATGYDINRQNAAANREYMKARNEQIIKLYNSGLDYKHIAERMTLGEGAVSAVILDARKKGRKIR